MKLYGYWRSSAVYRVRIALHHKGIPFEVVPINLLAGEQLDARYRDVNPQGLVPTLVDGDRLFHQSLAILEYLEETHPSPPLLPTPPHERARVRALADLIACDVHPLQNTRVGLYLIEKLGHTEEERLTWFRHWMTAGLAAFEELVARSPSTGRFCHGDRVTMADVLLVPQLGNARRVECDLEAFPTLTRIEAECLALESFQKAHPNQQPDARP
jgi:maleylacetoacetate isomerase